jgi:hypothetical protein
VRVAQLAIEADRKTGIASAGYDGAEQREHERDPARHPEDGLH